MTELPRFRHLDYGASPTIEQVGPAGLQALLDQHGLDAWRPILRSIADDPWGVVAQRVEQVLDHLETHGTGPLVRAWLQRCRGGLDVTPQGLADLRRDEGLSQRDVAERMGVSQAQVARTEKTTRPTTRSVRRYLHALGLTDLGTLATDGRRIALVTFAGGRDLGH